MLDRSIIWGNGIIKSIVFSAEIALHKGLTVFNELERYDMVQSIKWVDEVRRFVYSSIGAIT